MKSNPVVLEVLNYFHDNDILYCHWKSNEHLEAAIEGTTDLDLLFEHSKEDEISTFLISKGFVKGRSPRFKKYPHIDDFLYINEVNNNVIHIHAHYKLIVGETNVKSYHLDWEGNIFETRVKREDLNIYTTSYEYELLLLIIRIGLKNNWSRRFLLRSVLNSTKVELLNSKRELQWLLERVDLQIFRALVINHLDENLARNISGMLDSDFSYKDILRLSHDIQNVLSVKSRYSRFKSFLIGQSRELDYFSRRVVNKLGIVRIATKRLLPHNGFILAILGADGTGKSTTTGILRKVLEKKFDVVFVYMGSGKGESSFFRKPLNWLRTKIHKKKTKSENKLVNFTRSEKVSRFKELGNIVWAISLYKERNSKLNYIEKLKERGYIVVTDRFPQNSTYGYNDGPLLQDYLSNSFFLYRFFARQEQKIFQKTERIFPDLLVRLYADPEIIKSRRPQMTEEAIVRKQNNVLELCFNDRTNVINVNTNKPIDLVVSEVLKEIQL